MFKEQRFWKFRNILKKVPIKFAKVIFSSQWTKSLKKQSIGVYFWHFLSAELTKTHSFRLFFWRFYSHSSIYIT